METAQMLYKPIDFRFAGVYETANSSKPPSFPTKTETPLKYSFNIHWPKVFSIGPGFRNLGNTCFFNSVLQCITYTAPLASHFLGPKAHNSSNCTKDKQNCWLCLLSQHYHQIFVISKAKTMSPIDILRCLRGVWKKFRLGSQEDAHEFLRIFLDNVQKADKLLINGVFAGVLKNQVQCLDCKAISEKSDPFLDLSLEVQKSESIQKSLEIFFQKESLTGNNKYRCGKCKKLVNALKGFSLEEGPMILTIHLKRFNNSLMKINKFVRFSEKLDLSNFVLEKKKLIYELFAVVVHQGSQMWSGHYYSYVKNSNNLWYIMNDESVRLSNLERVLKENAYILFYSRKEPEKNGNTLQKPASLLQINGVTSLESTDSTGKSNNINSQKTPVELINGNSHSKNNENYASRLNKVKESEECRTYLENIFKRTSSQNLETKPNESERKSLMRSNSLTLDNNTSNGFMKPLNKTENFKKNFNENQENSHIFENSVNNGALNGFPALSLERSLSKSSMQSTKLSKLKKMKKMELWGDLQIKKRKTNNIDAIKICTSDKKLEKISTISEIFESKIEEIEKNDKNIAFLLEAKNKIIEENPEFFKSKIREKDAYDMEYDKGKLKKKKAKKIAKKNDFQKTSELLKQQNHLGYHRTTFKNKRKTNR